jgi:hypothetical protein
MPSRRASASIASCLRAKEKSVSAMVSVKCLAILYLPTTAPTLRPILAIPRSGLPARRTLFWISATSRSVCGEQILTLAPARASKLGVAADDQALAGIVFSGDAGKIAVIEQRELEDPRIDQGADALCKGETSLHNGPLGRPENARQAHGTKGT